MNLKEFIIYYKPSRSFVFKDNFYNCLNNIIPHIIIKANETDIESLKIKLKQVIAELDTIWNGINKANETV